MIFKLSVKGQNSRFLGKTKTHNGRKPSLGPGLPLGQTPNSSKQTVREEKIRGPCLRLLKAAQIRPGGPRRRTRNGTNRRKWSEFCPDRSPPSPDELRAWKERRVRPLRYAALHYTVLLRWQGRRRLRALDDRHGPGHPAVIDAGVLVRSRDSEGLYEHGPGRHVAGVEAARPLRDARRCDRMVGRVVVCPNDRVVHPDHHRYLVRRIAGRAIG